MTRTTDETYFHARERESREMAAKATDTNVRSIHLEMAKAYARRVAPCGKAIG